MNFNLRIPFTGISMALIKKVRTPIELVESGFHPDVLPDVRAAVAKLNDLYPPLDGCRVRVLCGDRRLFARLRKVDVDNERVSETSGVTTSEVHTGNFYITLNPDNFGRGANLARTALKELMTMGQHGGMSGAAFNVFHEYGHVIDNMIKFTAFRFEGKDSIWTERATGRMEKIWDYWNKANIKTKLYAYTLADKYGDPSSVKRHLKDMSTRQRDEEAGDNAPWNLFPTPYAGTSPEELMAECFAALMVGTDQQRKCEPVKDVKALVEFIWPPHEHAILLGEQAA